MRAKRDKVYVEQACRDHADRNPDTSKRRWLYRVTRLVNTLHPRVGEHVSEMEVEQMIRIGIDVTITPRKGA
jgi:hypothetical protein